ncbi:MAG: MBL fold metallo-hydrolase [bacterium]
MSIHVETLTVGPMAVNCYLAGDEEGRGAVLIDPGEEPERILRAVEEGEWRVERVLLTHAHFDHLLALRDVLEVLDVPFLLPEGEEEMLHRVPETVRAWMGIEVPPPPEPDRMVRGGERVEIGGAPFRVAETPGHSPGSITLAGEGIAFVGDAVFAGSIGRTDLPGGDHEILMTSIREQILSLPDDTLLYPGHGPSTTVGRERRDNPFLKGL